VGGAGQFQAATDHGAVQRSDHRHTAVLHGVERDVPVARVVHAFTGIAFLEFGQVQASAEVFAFAVNHGSLGLGRQVLEGVTNGFDQRIGQRVALGRTAQGDHGDGTTHFKGDAMLGCAFEDRVAHREVLCSG